MLTEVIGRRIDEAERRLGLSDAKGRESWEYRAGDGWYDGLELEWYDNDWERRREYYINLREDALAEQATNRIFRDGQGDLPPQSQDFFHYWSGFDPLAQDLHFKVDDWDED